jgi:hypothetical protein
MFRYQRISCQPGFAYHEREIDQAILVYLLSWLACEAV